MFADDIASVSEPTIRLQRQINFLIEIFCESVGMTLILSVSQRTVYLYLNCVIYLIPSLCYQLLRVCYFHCRSSVYILAGDSINS